MSYPDFPSDKILSEYERLNNLDWLTDEEEETLYPRNESCLSENTFVIRNDGSGVINCTNEGAVGSLGDNREAFEGGVRDFSTETPNGQETS